MARSVDKMLLEMVVENKKAIKNLNAVQKKGNQINKESKGFFKSMKAGWLGAAAGIFVAVRAVGKIFSATLKQQKVQQQLNAVLKSTGGVAGLTAKEITKMAASLQKVTTFGDEAIIEGQNLLLTFKKIGKDVFPRATETMLDVAQAMGQDMKTTAVQLGKALNDPIQGLTALRRVGITFTADQENVIKAMVKTGDIASAQTKILDELESQFGGSARAAAEGLGAWTQFSNVMGDIAEKIGGALSPAVAKLSKFFIKVLTPAEDIESVTQDLIKSQTEYTEVVRKLKDEQNNLSDAEKTNLEIRKQVLELDILSQIDELNKKYKEQTSSITKLIKVDTERNEGLKLLKSRILGTKDETIKLTKVEQDLLTSEAGLNKSSLKLFAGDVNRIETLKKITSLQKVAKEATVERTTAEQELQTVISLIASALLNKAITEEQLIGLDQQLLEQIRERVPLIEAEIEAESRKESTKVVNHQAELQRIETEKKAKIAADKVIEKEKANAKKRADKLIVQKKKADEQLRAAELEATKSSLGQISTLMQSSNRTLFNIGKAAALAQAGINVAEGFTKALTAGPILGPILGVAILAAGAVQIAKIASTTLPAAAEGMDSAPGGPVLVGERGPEVVNLPVGSQVIPNHKINMSRFNTIPAFANGGVVGAGDTIENSGQNIIIEQLVMAAETPADFADQLMDFQESLNVDMIDSDS